MKQNEITPEEYTKIMDKIIAMNLGIADKLIMMLEKAGQYKILCEKKLKKKK